MTLWIAGAARIACTAKPSFNRGCADREGRRSPQITTGHNRFQITGCGIKKYRDPKTTQTGKTDRLAGLFLFNQLIIAKQMQHLFPGSHTVLVAKLHKFLAIGRIKHQVTH